MGENRSGYGLWGMPCLVNSLIPQSSDAQCSFKEVNFRSTRACRDMSAAGL